MMKRKMTFASVLTILIILLISFPTVGQSAPSPSAESLPLARPLGERRPELPGGPIVLELAPLGELAPPSTSPQQAQADVNLVLDDGSAEGSLGIGGTSEFIFLNRFTPNLTDFAFDLTQIQVYFRGGGSNVQVGDDIRLVVYENTSGNLDPAVGATWRASFPATVQALDAWNVYALSTPVHFDGPGDVLIGVIALEKPGSDYFPAAIDQTTSRGRSWVGWWSPSPPPEPPTLPPNATWALVDDAGYPGNWMIRGYGVFSTQTPRVQLDPPSQEGWGQPGNVLHYTVLLTNYTGQADSFTITRLGNQWPVTHPATLGPVANGGSQSFRVDVTIPGNADCSECDTVVIRAQAQAQPVFSDTVTIKTCVGEDWQNRAATPQGAHWMAYTCTDAVGVQGACFYFGGLGPGNTLTGYSQKYDIATGTWTRIKDMPTPVFGATAGYINGKVYVAGGFISMDWTPSGKLQIYNVATNSWSNGANLPIPRGGTVGGAVGGKLYVANGMDKSYDYRYLHEYNPTTNAWTEKAPVPDFFDFGAAAVSNDHLYIGGGYFGENGFFEYNPATDTWETRANLPGGAGKKSPVMAVAPDCGGVFLYGGDLGEWNDIQDTTWYWHPVEDAWLQYSATLNQRTTGAGGGYAAGKLWSFGGSLGIGPIGPPPHESLAYCCPAGPPTGSISGLITDANTGRPLQNANVYLYGITDPGFEDSTWTDSGGRYTFGSLLVADYEVRAAAYGYDRDQAQVMVLKDKTVVQDFALTAAYPELSLHAVGVNVPVTSTLVFTLTLDNHGTGNLRYHISELPADSAFRPTEMPTGVDPRLSARLSEAPDGKATFIVYLAEQADLSEAFTIKDRSTRGHYVLNALRTIAERSQAGLRAQLERAGVKYRSHYIVNALVVEGNLSLVESLAARPEVAYIGANNVLPVPEPVEAKPATEAATGVEWNISKVKANQVWSTFGIRGEGIIVANIDTGVEYTHPALVNQYRGTLGGGGYDHNHNWWDPYGYDPSAPADFHGHGTHTMGIMVGDDGAGNQIGMAPGARWFTCQGFDKNTGVGYEAELLECAEFVLAPWDLNGANPDPDLRADVVNNSWGGDAAQWWYNQAVYAWRAAGILPSFSAGNSGPECETAGDPGDMENALSVGATDSSDNNAPGSLASFSSRGPAKITGLIKPDVSAPGANIRSSLPDNAYGIWSGTSMASPHAAGEAALLWAAQPDLRGNVQLTYWIMEQSTDHRQVNQEYFCGADTTTSIPNNQYGWGRINAYKAVDLALDQEWDVPWLAVEPVSGTVPVSSDQAIGLTFDTSGLARAQCYNSHLKFEYNDPYIREEFVPVALCVDLCLPLTNLDIVGPSWLFVDHEGTYSAGFQPITATLPVTITWSNGTTGQSAPYGWSTTGTHTIVVTATNCDGSTAITDSLEVNVVPVYPVYLPLVLKRY
ncbi:MAG: S8 family serine peptidase [Anaerolineae bacterium]